MTESMQRESRRRKRHAVGEEIEVYDSSRAVCIGHLANIHSEGLLVVGTPGLQEDHLYQLELRLPQALGGDAIRLGVDCLWVRAAGEGASAWSGCQIIDLSDSARAQLEQLLTKL